MLLFLQHEHTTEQQDKTCKKQQDQKGETRVNAQTEHQDPANWEARPDLDITSLPPTNYLEKGTLPLY